MLAKAQSKCFDFVGKLLVLDHEPTIDEILESNA
mgnify:CR=1 FL=1